MPTAESKPDPAEIAAGLDEKQRAGLRWFKWIGSWSACISASDAREMERLGLVTWAQQLDGDAWATITVVGQAVAALVWIEPAMIPPDRLVWHSGRAVAAHLEQNR